MLIESVKKGDVFKVLDHGYIKVIDWMGDDTDIVKAARMSTGRGFEGWDPGKVCKECRTRLEDASEDASKHTETCSMKDDPTLVPIPGDIFLLETLLSNRHTTPFEMVELKIEVMAPIMVYREWHRHRTQSYSEFSARYAQMPNLHYIPALERIVKQSKSNKQGSSNETFPEDDAREINYVLEHQQGEIYNYYDSLVKRGVANEIARVNTPVSRYSKMTAKTDLWNWLAFLNLREDPPAQWEIRQYALIVSGIIKCLFPKTHGLWEEYMRYAIRLSRTEHKTVMEFLNTLPEEHKMILNTHALHTLGEKKAKAFMAKILNPKA